MYLGRVQPTPLEGVSFNDGPLIWCKLEFLNPSGSTKDRIARFILEKAFREKRVQPGTLVVEASSGSTSIAMALVSAQLGLRFTAVMPEGVSAERTMMIRGYGGNIVLTPKADGIRGALAEVERLRALLRARWQTDVQIPRPERSQNGAVDSCGRHGRRGPLTNQERLD